MKILLLGEFSSLHKNLKEGLELLGHEVKVASNGDSWKGIERDIDTIYHNKLLPKKLVDRIYPLLNIKKYIGYDIIQLISPDIIYKKFFPNKIFFNILKKYNNKIFLVAAGSDGYFWKYGPQRLRYSVFKDTLKYDLKSKSHPSESPKYFNFNKYIADKCNGIIPVVFEYEKCYEGHKNLLKTIPIPINIDKIKFNENIVLNKLVVFHGLSRYGLKGTRHVKKAFDILKSKYPNDLELIIDGKLPINQYLELIRKSNIIVDQTNCYSVGLNGLYAMAMGKIVLGGAEPESLLPLGVNSTPVINITPNYRSIVTEIENLLKNKDKIKGLGYKSRKFVENNHDGRKIAQTYLETWMNA